MSFKEFEKFYKLKANEHGQGPKIIRDSKTYVLYLHLFVEWFFMHPHRMNKVSRADMKEAGLDKLIKSSIATWLKYEENIALSLIFVGANYSLAHLDGLKKDAYNVGLEIYEKCNNDFGVVANEVITLYKDKAREKVEKICNTVPDKIIAQHSRDLDSIFLLKTKTIKNIKKALNQKLEDMLMFRMEDSYNIYLNKCKQKELEKATKEAIKETKREEMV